MLLKILKLITGYNIAGLFSSFMSVFIFSIAQLIRVG
jgi:hypothetical protein